MIDQQKRDFLQKESAQKIIQNNYTGIFEVCPRFGKTKTILMAIKDIKEDIYISSPYTDIKTNWVKESKFWNINKNYTEICHKSLEKIPNNLFLLIIDEAQALSVNNLKTIREKKPQRILFLSGYLKEKTLRYIKYWTDIDNHIFKYTIEDGIKDRIISDFKVKLIPIQLNNTIRSIKVGNYSFTEKQVYDWNTEKFEFYKEKSQHDASFIKTKELFARRRREFLCKFKTKIEEVIRLKNSLNKRVILFTTFTEVAEKLSSYSFHSLNKSLGNLKRFQDLEISELAVCNMVSMGITLPKLKNAILHQVVSNSELSVQKILRVCNLENEDEEAIAYLFYYKDTVEEEWVIESLEGIPESKIVGKIRRS